jgi:hypothetical protein
MNFASVLSIMLLTTLAKGMVVQRGRLSEFRFSFEKRLYDTESSQLKGGSTYSTHLSFRLQVQT